MIKKGVYAASLSILNKEKTLNIDLTINHAVHAIKIGLLSWLIRGIAHAADPRNNRNILYSFDIVWYCFVCLECL